jgi:hypothetical protein
MGELSFFTHEVNDPQMSPTVFQIPLSLCQGKYTEHLAEYLAGFAFEVCLGWLVFPQFF